MPGELGNNVNETEMMPNRALHSEPGHRTVVAIHAPRGRVAELGSLERNVRNKTAKRPTLRSSVAVKVEEEVCWVALSPTQPTTL